MMDYKNTQTLKTEKQMALAAEAFAARWEGRGYEKGDSQLFWTELLTEVFGVENPSTFIRYEEQVKVDKTNFIDGHIPSTRVLIEQKSKDKDLRKGIVQSDGRVLTPFQQAKRYVANMPLSEHPRWIVTCNFQEFLVYDMEQPNAEPQQILLRNIGREYYRLLFLVSTKSEHLSKEMQVSLDAGKIVASIYDALLRQYDDDSPEALRWLNILCVRLVFCFYAEDAGIFSHDQFHDYLVRYDASEFRNALMRLFEVLNTPPERRSRYLKDDLKAFPYTNGGLFEEEIEIPQFTDEMKQLLLHKASYDFDWSEISPTIFGAVFESTLNPETRRAGGMHYTSIENIHRVIDPLFLSGLRRELDDILEERVERHRVRKLDAFQERLSRLRFFDPACGSGNFLTETYLSLRRLENEVIRERYRGQTLMGEFLNPVKVSIQQFYGVEINDFAVSVATTALWISEAQMLRETERIVQQDIEFLPLKSYTNIREGNALRMDWERIVPREQLDYIIGNPPFVGARWMSRWQKDDVLSIFGKEWPGVGDLDYVACWYKKAADLMAGTHIRTALVSTNSITQGGAVANLWKPLFGQGIKINFAWRSFRWDSEASLKAHVHCVIVGFSFVEEKEKTLFLNEKQHVRADNINAYLLNAPDVFIEKRMKPICDVPAINLGGQPIDDGNLILTVEEKEEFLKKEPQAEIFLRPYMMGKDFINRIPRYCLWLKGASPSVLRTCPSVLERIELVKNFRLASNRSSTKRAAEFPSLFGAPFECTTDYIALPKVSSGNRKYVPIEYLKADVIPGDKLFCMENASMYHLGILQSIVHMAWMRATCGRLKSDYSYSNTIVYNNFPWPAPTEEQRSRIERTAQGILDARALYPDSSLADLYDELTMPAELQRAHQDNDRAVMQAYGFPVKSDFTESQCVAALFRMYEDLTRHEV